MFEMKQRFRQVEQNIQYDLILHFKQVVQLGKQHFIKTDQFRSYFAVNLR